MRFINKYKKFPKLDRYNCPQLPLRVLKFQRPKWKKFQKLSLTFKKAYCNFIDPLKVKLSYKHWDKVQNYYKAGIQIKRKILTIFDASIKKDTLKKELSQKSKLNNDLFLSTLVKPEFRIDILLWRLNLVSSCFEARQRLNNKEITVNGKFVRGNMFLKKGDVISFQKQTFFNLNLVSILKRIYTHQKISTFIEVDFYTQTLVVVKDLKELTSDDFNFFTKEYLDLKKFRDYL